MNTSTRVLVERSVMLAGVCALPLTTHAQVSARSVVARSVFNRFVSIAPGVERLNGNLGDSLRTEYYVLRVRPGERRVELYAVADPINGAGSLRKYFGDRNAIAGVSGGALRSYYPPLPTGLVIANDRQLSPYATDPLLDGLVLFRTDGRITIALASARLRTSSGSQLQTGPRLVAAGRALEPSSRQGIIHWRARSPRAFIAVDDEGRTLLGWTGTTTPGELARILADPAGPFRVRDAVSLGGQANAGIMSGTTSQPDSRGDVSSPLHNAIIIR